MFVFIEQSDLVASGFAAGFDRQGVPLASFRPHEFKEWFFSTTENEIHEVEAFIVGNCDQPDGLSKAIRSQTRAPIIAIPEAQTLEYTLAMFDAGVDDVVRRPVNVRELLARVEAVRRRSRPDTSAACIGRLKVHFDGSYPEIDGAPFPLPRRERRILEFLTKNRGKWMTKQQVFTATYGIFDDEVQESVVESHISKLRRKLAAELGHDPIEAKRFLGYRVDFERPPRDAAGSGQAGVPVELNVFA
jgi:DNA-binding response OmpR family regulator